MLSKIRDGFLSKLPKKLRSPKELSQEAKELAENNSQMVEEISERIADAIPGTVDDKIINTATDKLTGK